jgi:hypothetical protein
MEVAAERLNERARKRVVLVAAILGSAVVFIDMTVVNVALPAMQRDLGGGLTLQQWVVDAYLLTLGSLILLGGSLALQGIAGALLTPAALATIAATFEGEERGAAIGTWSARIGPRLFMAAGPFLCAAGILMMLRLGRHLDYDAELLPPVLVFALGLALTVAPVTTTVLADADPGDAGIASAVNNAVARVAALLGIAVVGVAVAGPHSRLTVHGFHLALAINAGLLVTGGVVGLVGIGRGSGERGTFEA